MSSRQEQKEQRRKEREEREAAAAAKAKRGRLVQLIGGVVVACAIIAGVAFAVSSSGGGDGGDDNVDSARLKSAATASGCVYRAFPDEGQDHVSTKLTAADFKTNPPTSGSHNPEPAPDGIYLAGNEPDVANWVHTLEHGRILLQYKPGVEKSVVTQLQGLFNENVAGSGAGYHSVLMQNNTKMAFAVAAVAWRHYMGCSEFTPKSIEALRAFREELVDKAPEKIP